MVSIHALTKFCISKTVLVYKFKMRQKKTYANQYIGTQVVFNVYFMQMGFELLNCTQQSMFHFTDRKMFVVIITL